MKRELDNCHLPRLPASRPCEIYNHKNQIAGAASCHARELWLHTRNGKFSSCRHWLHAWNAIPVYPATDIINRLSTTFSAGRHNSFAGGTRPTGAVTSSRSGVEGHAVSPALPGMASSGHMSPSKGYAPLGLLPERKAAGIKPGLREALSPKARAA